MSGCRVPATWLLEIIALLCPMLHSFGSHRTNTFMQPTPPAYTPFQYSAAATTAIITAILPSHCGQLLLQVCLLDQKYILDDSLTVKQLLQQQAAALLGAKGGKGASLAIRSFLRVQVGEGLEQQQIKDFASEVAEMAGGGSS